MKGDRNVSDITTQGVFIALYAHQPAPSQWNVQALNNRIADPTPIQVINLVASAANNSLSFTINHGGTIATFVGTFNLAVHMNQVSRDGNVLAAPTAPFVPVDGGPDTPTIDVPFQLWFRFTESGILREFRFASTLPLPFPIPNI
jgi:hypothetical protein